ncbi:MAG: glycosyltransferase [Acidobacteriia bacterium]|nr:glycosyltransferase [Terriglobia bacterium]
MRITIILCTYNRCLSLARTLQSVAASRLPGSVEWEVLVVDNNSPDQTREVVVDFSRQYPGRFRYQFEARQGKSHALNAGVREARGEVLAFLDDDVTVEPEWLANLTGILHDERWAGAGGRILPPQGFSAPNWLSTAGRYTLAPFAHFNPGPDPSELAEPPWGTNMAFRKTMFERYGGFRTDLGPSRGSEIRNEDTEFGRRLLAAGEHLFYVPSAVVYHPVPDVRLQKQYHLAWWFAKGRADVREFGVPADTARLLGIPLHLFARAIILTLRWTVALGSSRRFASKRNLWTTLGAMTECFRESRDSTITLESSGGSQSTRKY